MEGTPFPVFGLESTDVDSFMASYAALKTAFDPTFDPDYVFPSADYFLFKQYERTQMRLALDLHTAGPAYIMFWLIRYNSGSARSAKHEEYQAWGTVTLRTDFGHVVIKEKTPGDAFMNMIHHTEVAFPEDKRWSHRFCTMATDRDMAGHALNDTFRAALTDIDIPGFTLEILGKQLLIGNHKIITPEQTLRIARLLSQLAQL